MTRSKVWANFRVGIEFVDRFVKLSVSRAVPLARKAVAWARPRAKAAIRTFIAHSRRALRWTAIELARVTAVVIASLERNLPKAIDRAAAFTKEATRLTLAALRAGAEFAKLHRPHSPAVDTRGGRFWWHGVEALEGATAALRRTQKRLALAMRALSQKLASVGTSSGPPRDPEADQADVAAGEQHVAAFGPATSQSVMSSGASPSESSSSRISSR